MGWGFYLALGGVSLLVGAWLRRTRTRVAGAGRHKSLGTRALEAEASLLQRLTPLQQFSLYLDGFHFESGHLGRQCRACHYCTLLSEDLVQCVLFDGPVPEARLIGVEYIISEPLFEALPPEEKPLWHTHFYEVKSGQLAAPRLPGGAELQLMDKLRTSYGKLWLTWDTAQESRLPLGIPKLMMGFTEDGQLRPELLAERDRLLRLSSGRTRQRRAALGGAPVAGGADAWQKGDVLQLQLAPSGMSFRQS